MQNTFLHPDRTVCSRSYRMYRLFNPCRNRRPSWPALSEDLLTDLTEEETLTKKTGPTVERTEKTEKEQPEEETNAAVDSVQMDPPCPDTATERFNRNLRRVRWIRRCKTQEPSESAQPVQRQEPEPAKPGAIVDTAGGRTGRTRRNPSESSRVEQPSELPIPQLRQHRRKAYHLPPRLPKRRR